MRHLAPSFAFFFASFALFAAPCRLAAGEGDSPRTVTREELARAMRQHGAYDLSKTTNAGRLQAETLLALARDAREQDPACHPLVVGHEDWFAAYLDVAGLTRETAPLYARLGHEYGQDVRVEYRPERVVRRLEGPRPRAALQVTIWWPASSLKADRYSYEDTLSVPRLQATNHRVITYYMLDFGDMIVLDDIRGLTGRPTTGLLSLLFRLIGEGDLVETRIALSPDGLQVVRGTGRKGFFSVTTTATITPDGLGVKGIPDGRPDLKSVEDRLKRPIEVEYVPLVKE